MRRRHGVLAAAVAIWALQMNSVSHAELVSPQGNDAVAIGSDDGFVTVPLGERQLISGKRLLVIAYAVIFGLFLTYLLVLLSREKSLERATIDLQKKVETSAQKRPSS